MSDHQQDNAARIAAYLENKLSPEAREAFKRSLSEDDALRIQYVEALMNRGGKGEAGGAGAEEGQRSGGEVHEVGEGEMVSPEAGIVEGEGEREGEGEGKLEEYGEEEERREGEEQVEGGMEEQGEREMEDVVVVWTRPKWDILGRAWVAGLVALLIIVAGVGIYLLMDHENSWSRGVGRASTDTVKAAVSGAATAAVASGATDSVKGGRSGTAGGNAGSSALGDSVYTRFYKRYDRGNDPMELRKYYQEYRAGNYSAIVEKGDSPALGVGPRALLIRDYMRLYVGLSYLASGDARNAVTELEGVVLRTKPGDILYETAKWYLVLAWLKRNDVDPSEAQGKASGLAREISHGYSRYREPARELLLYFSN